MFLARLRELQARPRGNRRRARQGPVPRHGAGEGPGVEGAGRAVLRGRGARSVPQRPAAALLRHEHDSLHAAADGDTGRRGGSDDHPGRQPQRSPRRTAPPVSQRGATRDPAPGVAVRLSPRSSVGRRPPSDRGDLREPGRPPCGRVAGNGNRQPAGAFRRRPADPRLRQRRGRWTSSSSAASTAASRPEPWRSRATCRA